MAAKVSTLLVLFLVLVAAIHVPEAEAFSLQCEFGRFFNKKDEGCDDNHHVHQVGKVEIRNHRKIFTRRAHLVDRLRPKAMATLDWIKN